MALESGFFRRKLFKFIDFCDSGRRDDDTGRDASEWVRNSNRRHQSSGDNAREWRGRGGTGFISIRLWHGCERGCSGKYSEFGIAVRRLGDDG